MNIELTVKTNNNKIKMCLPVFTGLSQQRNTEIPLVGAGAYE